MATDYERTLSMDDPVETKFVTFRYNRDRFLANGIGKWYEESPVRSSERRSRNRTPTPAQAPQKTPQNTHDKATDNNSDPVISPTFPPGTSTHHYALQSLSEYTTRLLDQDADWLLNVHTVCDRLHLLKELHKEVQILKKRKVAGKTNLAIFQSSPGVSPILLEDDAGEVVGEAHGTGIYLQPFQDNDDVSTDSSSHQSLMPPTQEPELLSDGMRG